jgi:hypothetical protein
MQPLRGVDVKRLVVRAQVDYSPVRSLTSRRCSGKQTVNPETVSTHCPPTAVNRCGIDEKTPVVMRLKGVKGREVAAILSFDLDPGGRLSRVA